MPPRVQNTVRTRRSILVCCGMICLLPLLALQACGGATAPLPPLVPLHLPNVAPIPGIVSIQEQTHDPYLNEMQAYRDAASGGDNRAMFEIAHRLYSARLDGSGLEQVASAIPCTDAFSITSDGRWLACRNDDGIGLIPLTESGAGVTTATEILPNQDNQYQGSPTWAPDGQHLAVISYLGGGCSIAIYQEQASYTVFHLTAVLTFAQFAVQDAPLVGCTLGNLAWSPDGAWLAFVQARSPQYTVYALHLSALTPNPLAPAVDAEGQPLVLTIATGSLVIVGFGGGFLSWRHSTLALTFEASHTNTVVEVDLKDLTQRIVLGPLPGPPPEDVCNASWTPDDRHLVFLVCAAVSTEFVPPPAQPYVYTPPGANV